MPLFERFSAMLENIESPDGEVLYIRAALDDAAIALGAAKLTCEQTFRPEYDRLAAADYNVVTKAAGEFALVLVNATRSRTETLGNIARGWRMLRADGAMLVNADKSEGADSLLKHLRSALPVTVSLSKSHGRLIRLDKANEPAPDWSKALAPAPNADSYLTVPGTFSAEHADVGSRILAGRLGPEIKGRVADLGGGWGYLAAQALTRCPGISEIFLYEAEVLALDCARRNVVDGRAQFLWTDVTTLGQSGPPFDVVVCNPPFHATRIADHQLGIEFIKAAARILKPGGAAWFVANRQLPYESELNASFVKVERIEQSAGYKIFRCERPRKGGRK